MECYFHKYTWTSTYGKNPNENDNTLIDRKWHSSTLDVRNLRAAGCDNDHYLVVAKIMEN
jgi:hypothetical protein